MLSFEPSGLRKSKRRSGMMWGLFQGEIWGGVEVSTRGECSFACFLYLGLCLIWKDVYFCSAHEPRRGHDWSLVLLVVLVPGRTDGS
ncbi:hypothetical protein BDV27DRAFT_39874 [Aspergillus caelatus]|uniref:Uncharacterized protein n=1 Tax=Aspergillus caelatus TaxID=61420 RepID=A0A5N7AFL6_9EURO|nr:uncharacterized protein BDV27DRAFT_39874 [Aspergillus caelatus]KAE8368515.1 hypothetical protein BDV27DRAFT_39874 [Aspergillus caelatus]